MNKNKSPYILLYCVDLQLTGRRVSWQSPSDRGQQQPNSVSRFLIDRKSEASQSQHLGRLIVLRSEGESPFAVELSVAKHAIGGGGNAAMAAAHTYAVRRKKKSGRERETRGRGVLFPPL